jgi:hypothetical protein
MRKLLLLLVLVACGKSEDAPAKKAPVTAPAPPPDEKPAPLPTPAPPAEPPADDRCDVKIEGDENLASFSAGGAMTVGSDYWQSPDELKAAISALVKDKSKLDEEMRKDPVFYTVLVNCGRGDLSVNLGPAMGSKYADVPFGPKKYALKAQGAKPGDFQAMVSVKREMWVPVDGFVDITRFDKSGITGTFEANVEKRNFGSKDAPKKGRLTGKFTLKCSFPTSVCKEGLGK